MALTDKQIRSLRPSDKPFKVSDSQGLFLLVHSNGSLYWRMKYRFGGKEKLLSFGLYPDVSLADARRARDEARRVLNAGEDPSAGAKAAAAEKLQADTFESVAMEWHQRSSAKWSRDHALRIKQRLAAELFPSLGDRPVQEIRTKELLEVLRGVEARGAFDLASRLRQHMDGILRYAVQTDRIESNPAADLAGALTVRKTRHRPALPLEAIPDLLQRIERYQGRKMTRLALKFSLLTFVRSSELRFTRWDEINVKGALWTIPGQREELEGVKHSHRGAKMKEPHVVPLSRQALAILDELRDLSGNGMLVFPNDHDLSKPMSENTVNSALRKMDYDTKKDVCGHGFRAMACSALLESGLWSEDAIERQMSHKERNGVRAAYIHKAEFLDQRRLMVQWWADWLDANRPYFISPHEFAKRTV